MTGSGVRDADAIWNRACGTFDIGPATPPGDAALAALLLCHGMAMNGGLVHACEGLEADQLSRAVAGYRFFGLDAAADSLAEIARRAAELEADDPAADDLEDEANRRYDEALPEWDETIDRAFRSHLRDHAEAYAPVGG